MFFAFAGMAELADAQDLGSCGAIRVGSTPTTRTSKKGHDESRDLFCWVSVFTGSPVIFFSTPFSG